MTMRMNLFPCILISHLNSYVSGTGNLRHNPFKLDRWHYKSFQTSPSVFKSVQPSLRKSGENFVQKKCTYIRTHTHTHTHTHTYTHTQTFSDLVELSRMVYNTRGLRGSVQKSVFEAILYPFYRERQKLRCSDAALESKHKQIHCQPK